MRITKLNDYQSWLFEVGNTRIALDPWLTDVLRFPAGAWMFERRRHEPSAYTPDSLPPLDALIISAHFGDHLHNETLEALDKSTPVYTTKQAAPRLERLGFRAVNILGHGMSIELGEDARLYGVSPGFPYTSNALGFVLEECASEARLYFEAHTTDEAVLDALPQPITVMMTPVESVKLLGITFSMDAARALRSAKKLVPKFFLPTGVEPSRATGLFGNILIRCRGSIEDFDALLAESDLDTKLVNPCSGEGLTL